MPAKPSQNASAQDSIDAIALLVEDHESVKKLFKRFEQIKEQAGPAEKQTLVGQICAELVLHMEIEEYVFYPAARAVMKNDDMFNEAEVEHASAKELIAQLGAMEPSDEMYDAKVKVLSEYIEHHVGEEEEEMFPEAKKSKLDLKELGKQMQAMKEERQMEGISMPMQQSPAGGPSARV